MSSGGRSLSHSRSLLERDGCPKVRQSVPGPKKTGRSPTTAFLSHTGDLLVDIVKNYTGVLGLSQSTSPSAVLRLPTIMVAPLRNAPGLRDSSRCI
jgi:hypothetical protein